jgi:hypothetical protein
MPPHADFVANPPGTTLADRRNRIGCVLNKLPLTAELRHD